LELASRLSGDPAVGVLELAADVTNEEAEVVLAVLDEVEAEERAAGLVRDLRRAGQIW
jgi:hypothetical protein